MHTGQAVTSLSPCQHWTHLWVGNPESAVPLLRSRPQRRKLLTPRPEAGLEVVALLHRRLQPLLQLLLQEADVNATEPGVLSAVGMGGFGGNPGTTMVQVAVALVPPQLRRLCAWSHLVLEAAVAGRALGVDDLLLGAHCVCRCAQQNFRVDMSADRDADQVVKNGIRGRRPNHISSWLSHSMIRYCRVDCSSSGHLSTSPRGSGAGRLLLAPATAWQDTWLRGNHSFVATVATAAAAEPPSYVQRAKLWHHSQRCANCGLTFPRHDVGEDDQDARPSQQRGRLPVHGVTWAAAALHRCGQALTRVMAGANVLVEYLGY